MKIAASKETSPPRHKHPGGRPTKRTPALLRILSDVIAAGLTDEHAAALAGISRSTLALWLKAEGEFSDAIKKARAARLFERLRLVESGCRNWQAVAWILERAYGSQFARPKAANRLKHHAANEPDSATNCEATHSQVQPSSWLIPSSSFLATSSTPISDETPKRSSILGAMP